MSQQDDKFADLFRALSDADTAAASVSSHDLLAAAMREFGGEAGFIREVKRNYDESDSAPTRARILANMLDLSVSNAKLGKADDLEALSDEDLKIELELLIREMFVASPELTPSIADADDPAAAEK